MRRAIALAVGSGVVLGGAAAGPAWAREVKEIKAAPAATKTVTYAGYELRVPDIDGDLAGGPLAR